MALGAASVNLALGSLIRVLMNLLFLQEKRLPFPIEALFSSAAGRAHVAWKARVWPRIVRVILIRHCLRIRCFHQDSAKTVSPSG